MSYQIIEKKNRVYAVDNDGTEICGSFQPAGHSYWQLYVSKSIANLTGLHTPPHRENYWGNHGKIDSRRWVELIAKLYTLAAQCKEEAA